MSTAIQSGWLPIVIEFNFWGDKQTSVLHSTNPTARKINSAYCQPAY
ncbi:hypothetical protein M595_5913 [Lyngbya aestuarii BL J]|uniref:Uncharacterized protein n=1 Tax=Lyngbya aestuarii BL J TaxID=1348334 RepID=U7Q8I8_9CYAN|nr:hypothetical protein M595_5913 [Lyngbya aestuarii BL J]